MTYSLMVVRGGMGLCNVVAINNNYDFSCRASKCVFYFEPMQLTETKIKLSIKIFFPIKVFFLYIPHFARLTFR